MSSQSVVVSISFTSEFVLTLFTLIFLYKENQMKLSLVPCVFIMCLFRSPFVLNLCSHKLHLKNINRTMIVILAKSMFYQDVVFSLVHHKCFLDFNFVSTVFSLIQALLKNSLVVALTISSDSSMLVCTSLSLSIA